MFAASRMLVVNCCQVWAEKCPATTLELGGGPGVVRGPGMGSLLVADSLRAGDKQCMAGMMIGNTVRVGFSVGCSCRE